MARRSRLLGAPAALPRTPFARNLVDRMNKRGIESQKDFADQIGVKPPQLNGWMVGKYNQVSMANVIRLCKGLHCSVDDLWVGEDPEYDAIRRQTNADEAKDTPTRARETDSLIGNVPTRPELLQDPAIDQRTLGGQNPHVPNTTVFEAVAALEKSVAQIEETRRQLSAERDRLIDQIAPLPAVRAPAKKAGTTRSARRSQTRRRRTAR